MPQGNLFGGDWTKEMLDTIAEYLERYTTALKHQPFQRVYIDAFAGTGYVDLKHDEDPNELLLPEFAQEESVKFVDGAARIALQVEPRFTRYIFIEKNEKGFSKLEDLKKDFPNLAASIMTKKEDANSFLPRICKSENWFSQRALLFLDPYGMQVSWETIVAIAETKGIDLWLLFPLGVAVNRLLRKDGKIDLKIRQKLDRLFGKKDWYDTFYREVEEEDLFGIKKTTCRIATPDQIADYFVARLKTVFIGVAENPLTLYNSRGVPLYLLCFATSNKKGAPVALNLAQHILRKR